jgi:CRISPR/Cas system-associated protein Cas7 (RAMP superfamily)
LKDQGIDGIRMDLREIGLESVDWIYLAQDRDRWQALVNTVMDLQVLAACS